MDKINKELNQSKIIIKEQNNKIKQNNERIEKLEEEIKVKHLELVKSRQYLSIASHVPKLVDKYFGETKNDESFTFEEFFLSLNLYDSLDKPLVTSLSKINLPTLSRLTIDCISQKDTALLKLFNQPAPKLKLFCFNWANIDKINMKFYAEAMANFVKKTTKEVFIRYCIFDKESLEHVIKGASNSDRIIFRFCEFESSLDFDFSGPKYKTSYLGVPFCGDSDNCKWSDHPERLESFIKAISNSTLKFSLTTLNISGCDVPLTSVNDLLVDYDLTKLEVVFEENKPMEE